MKLILLHGNFQSALLKKITEIKSGFNPLSIRESLQADGLNFFSQSLFSDKSLFILENPDIKIIEQALGQTDPNLTILLKFSKSLEKSSIILKKVYESGGEVQSFEESNETSIFPFLDMLGNLNNKAFLVFEKNYNEFGGQYILIMLAYFLRRMILKSKLSSGFLRQKIESQRKNFSLQKITDLYRKIIETDFKVKQGITDEKIEITLLLQKILT